MLNKITKHVSDLLTELIMDSESRPPTFDTTIIAPGMAPVTRMVTSDTAEKVPDLEPLSDALIEATINDVVTNLSESDLNISMSEHSIDEMSFEPYSANDMESDESATGNTILEKCELNLEAIQGIGQGVNNYRAAVKAIVKQSVEDQTQVTED